MSTNTVDVTTIETAVERTLGGMVVDSVVEVGHSADDDGLLCVRVFGVPESMHSTVGDAIVTLSDNLFPDGDVALLPMPKTAAVTQEYYPEQYLRLLARRMSQACGRHLATWGQLGGTRSELDAGDAHVGTLEIRGLPCPGPDQWDAAGADCGFSPCNTSLDLAA